MANDFDRMLADAEILNSRLSKLEGAGDLGTHIVNVVKNKTVVADRTSGDAVNATAETTSNPDSSSHATADGVGDDGKTRVSADGDEKP